MSTRRDVRHTPDDLSIKAATEALVSAVGGKEKAEGYARPGRRFYSDYTGPNCDAFIPADAIVALEKRAVHSPGWPQVTRELARQTGHVLVQIPEARRGCNASLHVALAATVKEHGDAVASLLTGLADGALCARDLERALAELGEAIEASVQLRAMLQQLLDEGR